MDRKRLQIKNQIKSETNDEKILKQTKKKKEKKEQEETEKYLSFCHLKLHFYVFHFVVAVLNRKGGPVMIALHAQLECKVIKKFKLL